MQQSNIKTLKSKTTWKFYENIILNPHSSPNDAYLCKALNKLSKNKFESMMNECDCLIEFGTSTQNQPGQDLSPLPMLIIKFDKADEIKKLKQKFVKLIMNEVEQNDQRTQGRQQPQKLKKMPVTPAPCFYSIHYLAHAISDLTTHNLKEKYASFYNFNLEPKFDDLGNGNIGKALLATPGEIFALKDKDSNALITDSAQLSNDKEYQIVSIWPAKLTLNQFIQKLNKICVGYKKEVQMAKNNVKSEAKALKNPLNNDSNHLSSKSRQKLGEQNFHISHHNNTNDHEDLKLQQNSSNYTYYTTNQTLNKSIQKIDASKLSDTIVGNKPIENVAANIGVEQNIYNKSTTENRVHPPPPPVMYNVANPPRYQPNPPQISYNQYNAQPKAMHIVNIYNTKNSDKITTDNQLAYSQSQLYKNQSQLKQPPMVNIINETAYIDNDNNTKKLKTKNRLDKKLYDNLDNGKKQIKLDINKQIKDSNIEMYDQSLPVNTTQICNTKLLTFNPINTNKLMPSYINKIKICQSNANYALTSTGILVQLVHRILFHYFTQNIDINTTNIDEYALNWAGVPIITLFDSIEKDFNLNLHSLTINKLSFIETLQKYTCPQTFNISIGTKGVFDVRIRFGSSLLEPEFSILNI